MTNAPDPQQKQKHISLGFNLALGMGVLIFIGFWIDERKETEPLWTIVFVVVAFIYGIFELWKYLREINNKDR